ncbi:protein GRINL1A [Hyla sarda]|uniref:protein GRINL1A n=1 Tax=Hyla sarda TaxID=327740 RepID=UPI0024C27CC5|nr:protein GRINL1A [Hyla sarda]XP_056428392.1 protein GRINL1A [Hyla sarda]
MSAPVDRGKLDRAGDLHGKRLEELTEMLERQEKLLSNRNFIAKLPDRGKKILDYSEKIRAAIAKHNRQKEATDLLSSFRLQFQEQQCNLRENAESSEERDVSPTVAQGNKSSSSHTNAMDTKITDDLNSPASVKINEETCSNDSHTDENLVDDLAKNLKMISIKESGDNTNKDSSETSVYEKTDTWPGSGGAKKSHSIEVIERRSLSPVQRKEKFRTNRLPSDSNSSTPNQSPGDKALRMSPEQRKLYDRKHLDDITAARLPPLHYSPAQLLPLDESLTLQIVQKKTYEEKQAKHAAQKLFEKLNVKIGPFNPEGDSYMKYRDHRDDDQFGAGE